MSPWKQANRVHFFWGTSIDGFDILARFRARCPCESLLMDEASVHRWRGLAVPYGAGGSVDVAWLTESERTALDVLQREGLRLEQERIPMDAVVDLLMV